MNFIRVNAQLICKYANELVALELYHLDQIISHRNFRFAAARKLICRSYDNQSQGIGGGQKSCKARGCASASGTVIDIVINRWICCVLPHVWPCSRMTALFICVSSLCSVWCGGIIEDMSTYRQILWLTVACCNSLNTYLSSLASQFDLSF